MMTDSDLLISILKMWYQRSDRCVPLTFTQIAFVVMGAGTGSRASRVGSMISANPRYFVRCGLHKWKPQWHTINRDFPELMAKLEDPERRLSLGPEATHPASGTLADQLKEMCEAISLERRAVRDQSKKLRLPILGGRLRKQLSADEYPFVFEFMLSERDTDEPVPVTEGAPALLRTTSNASFDAIVVSIDEADNTVWVACKKRLDLSIAFERPIALEPNHDWLLERLRDAIARIDPSTSFLAKAIVERSASAPALPISSEPVLIDLDDAQSAAVLRMHQQPAAFVIWGPPGTGKTHTLGRVIATLVTSGLRVIGVATANVAVDRLAVATVKAFERSARAVLEGLLQEGLVVRYGYPRDPDVFAYPGLFRYRAERQGILGELKQKRIERDRLPRSDASSRAEVNSRIATLERLLKDVVSCYLQKSRVVFTTIAQAVSDSGIANGQFDIAVVDESSMVSAASAVAVSTCASRGLILAGDFKQLGPIAISQGELAARWLHRDAFFYRGFSSELAGPSERSDYAMLVHQRRMAPEIAACVNSVFYGGRLKSDVNMGDPERRRAVDLPPGSGKAAVLIDVGGMPGSGVLMTAGGSRVNAGTAQFSANLTRAYCRLNKTARIGVIAPYRAHVARLRLLLQDLVSQPAGAESERRVSIGTVHAFQGSEFDVVVIDLVECDGTKVGRLFSGETGDRLVNVAMSRAKSKLVVIADRTHFVDSAKVSALRRLFAERFFEIRSWRFVRDEVDLSGPSATTA